MTPARSEEAIRLVERLGYCCESECDADVGITCFAVRAKGEADYELCDACQIAALLREAAEGATKIERDRAADIAWDAGMFCDCGDDHRENCGKAIAAAIRAGERGK